MRFFFWENVLFEIGNERVPDPEPTTNRQYDVARGRRLMRQSLGGLCKHNATISGTRDGATA